LQASVFIAFFLNVIDVIERDFGAITLAGVTGAKVVAASI
jgi:hypothetical protein